MRRVETFDRSVGVEDAGGEPAQRSALDLLGTTWLAENVAQFPTARTPERRAAIYGRYSTANQHESSITRQVEVSKAYAARHGFTVQEAHVFSDEQRSGATTVGRSGLEALVELARAGEIEAVLVEDADRMSRDLADMSSLWKLLRRHGVSLHQATRGEMSLTEVAVYGLMSEEQRKSILFRTQAGLKAMVREGRVPRGSYGYRRVPGRPGVLEVDEAAAAVVRRIFRLRADGVSTNKIAYALNRSGIPSSLGKQWAGGVVAKILMNPAYRGIFVYGRTRTTTDYGSRKTTTVPLPVDQWIVSHLDHLRIVDPDLWDEVQRVMKRPARPKQGGGPIKGRTLLSGHLRCEACGGKLYTMMAPGYGVRRAGCINHYRHRTCGNKHTQPIQWIEGAVLSRLARELERAGLVQPHLDALNEAADRVELEVADDRRRLERRVTSLRADIDATWDERAADGFSPASVVRRRQELEGKLESAEGALALIPPRRARLVIDVARMAGLGAAMREIAESGPIRVVDDASARIVSAFDDLVGDVVVHRNATGFRVAIHVRLGPLAGYASCDDLGSKVIEASFTKPRRRRRRWRERAVIAAEFEAGMHALSDEEWARVSHLFPTRRTGRREGKTLDWRTLVEIALYSWRTPQPFGKLPEAFGRAGSIRTAVSNLIENGKLDAVVAVLAECSPERVAGLTHRFAPKPRKPAADAAR